jgi:phage/conjugal plasmid C-4 type zinc finger TraR family protein
MSDEIDFAQTRIETELASKLAARVIYTGQSARECDCGDTIPEARRVAVPGVQTCVACAERAALAKQGVRRA